MNHEETTQNAQNQIQKTPESMTESEIPAERIQVQQQVQPSQSHAQTGQQQTQTSQNQMQTQTNQTQMRKPLVLRDNTVFIGKKNAMSYVLAVVSQFNQGSNQVKIKARGRSITRAVDVSQIVKNKFAPNLKISLEDISTEDLQSEDGRSSRVSSITLLLSK